jgi:hypothetical protein
MNSPPSAFRPINCPLRTYFFIHIKMVLQLCYCVFFWIAEFSIGPFKEIYQVNVIRFFVFELLDIFA